MPASFECAGVPHCIPHACRCNHALHHGDAAEGISGVSRIACPLGAALALIGNRLNRACYNMSEVLRTPMRVRKWDGRNPVMRLNVFENANGFW